MTEDLNGTTPQGRGHGSALPVGARSIGQCVGFHAAREPDREAAVHGATRLSYRDLDHAVDRWARALFRAGVIRGDRVASLTPPSTEWLAIMLGTTEIGAIWTGYHPRYRMPEFQHVTGLAEPAVLIAFRRIHGRDYAQELAVLMAEHRSIRHLVMLDEPVEGGVMASEFLSAGDTAPETDAAERRSRPAERGRDDGPAPREGVRIVGDEGRTFDDSIPRDPRAPGAGDTSRSAESDGRDDGASKSMEAIRRAVGPEDTAVLIFTSGTTGRPKAAMITHRALLTGAAVENEHWPMDRPRLLHMMPVNHIAGVGMTGVFGLYIGGTLVFQDRFDAGDLLRLLEEERINHVLGSPVQFHMMANHPDFGSRDLSRLEFITWGGAPMAADLVARLHALPGELRTSYGMTELGLYVTYTEPGIDLDTLARTIGKPHPGFDIRVADASGAIAAPGEQGEIQARGDWLLAGYFRDREATADAYTADGWFRTGDVVSVRPDGNLEIVGRTREMYISGGFNIYPREVEIVIEAHPDVGLVAVLGVPDRIFGEVGHAFVEPKPDRNLDATALHAWCRDHLANYKVPKRFEIRAELPRLPIGKIDKQALKRELSQSRG